MTFDGNSPLSHNRYWLSAWLNGRKFVVYDTLCVYIICSVSFEVLGKVFQEQTFDKNTSPILIPLSTLPQLCEGHFMRKFWSVEPPFLTGIILYLCALHIPEHSQNHKERERESVVSRIRDRERKRIKLPDSRMCALVHRILSWLGVGEQTVWCVHSEKLLLP